MLSNRSQMIDAISMLAEALGDLNDRVVYVGGAVISLYVDDPGAPESRPTRDVDIVLEIASTHELEALRQDLALRGIFFASNETVMCRFHYQNILLDVLSTHAVSWVPSNPWFEPGFKNSKRYRLDDIEINIMAFPYFLASKVAAFLDRSSDARTSHDFEDIVYLLDNRSTLINDIIAADPQVRKFLAAQLGKILNDAFLQEAVMAHLEPATQMQRYEKLIQKLREIVGGVIKR